jgi:hypothetical protein
MVPFFVGEFFRRRRRRGYARDEMPFSPILEIVAFWILLVFGALFADMAILGFGAAVVLGLEWDRTTIILLAIAGLISPGCLWMAMVYWWRMTRERSRDH